MNQSPIRLQTSEAIPLIRPLRLFECLYKPGAINGCFEGEPGHGNFVLQGAGPHVRFRGVKYELKKIHIHCESEHIVDQDDLHDLEIHLVHAPLGSPVASPLVVVGILFKIVDKLQKSNKLGATIAELVTSAESRVCVDIDPLTLFPRNAKGKPEINEWFHYEGSLTGYPYSENVSWIVMRNSATIDDSSIARFEEFAEQHARELQPLDRRLVVRSFLHKADSP